MIRLDKQVALITGGARGLGFEYARLFVERGAIVILQDSGVSEDGETNDSNVVFEAASKLANNVVPIATDLSNKKNCDSLVDMMMNRFGRIDIMIHNAGWVAYKRIEDLTPDFLQRSIDVNILIPTWLAHAIFPVMKRQRHGRIVLTSSDRAIYEEYGLVGLAPYAMGKMAQIGLMNILAIEGQDFGIRVNTLSPVAKTRMWGVEAEPVDMKPKYVAQATLYLASSECTSTGYILRASNKQFSAVKWIEREGVDYPYDLNAFSSDSAEDIAANWNAIVHHLPS